MQTARSRVVGWARPSDARSEADGVPTKLNRSTYTAVILRSRALARRLEGWQQALVAHPSRLAVKNGEHLRMTAVYKSWARRKSAFAHPTNQNGLTEK